MRRADSTSREYQLAYRGTHHIPADGLYDYPDPKRATRKRGSRYLRCNCGWRLVEIARTRSERAKAGRLHNEHVLDIQTARGEAACPGCRLKGRHADACWWYRDWGKHA